jgi:hypothetical protein
MPGLSPLFISSVSIFGAVILALLLAIIVTLVIAFWPNPTTEIPLPGGVGFPSVYPIINKTINEGSNGPSCFNMITNNKNEKQYSNRLVTCQSEIDCTNCENSSCQVPTDKVRQVQKNMFDNDSDKYCLPNLGKCLPGGCDFTKYTTCRQDSDCELCNDTLQSETEMKCVSIGENQNITIGSDKCVSDAERRICLPKPAYCDPANGIPTWVDDGVSQRWNCECRYPNVYGGADCSTLVACNNHLVLPQTQDQQKLLINVGPEVGVEWTPDASVPPEEMRCSGSWQLSCSGDNPCKDGTKCVPSTVCQCDGINAFSGSTFKNPGVQNNEMDLLNTCVNDTCFSTMQRAGRFDHTINKCICSGDSRLLWEIDQKTGAYDYKNSCTSRQIGNVVLEGNTTTCFDPSVPANSQPVTTGLVDLVVPNFESGGTGTTHVCGLDPCMGLNQSPQYPPKLDTGHGHWDPKLGTCICDTNTGFFEMDVNAHNAKWPIDKFSNNSKGHICYNPCPPTISSLCGGRQYCDADPLNRFGYICKCGPGTKPTDDNSACVDCKDGTQYCSSAADCNCCGKAWVCNNTKRAGPDWYSCKDDSDAINYVRCE